MAFKFQSRHSFTYTDRMIPAYYPGEMIEMFGVDQKRSCEVNSTLPGEIYDRLLRNELFDSEIKGSDPVKLFSYRRKRSVVTDSPFSLSPLSLSSQKILVSNKRRERDISGAPYKILGAQNIIDDFYLNLLDWSSTNVIALALNNRLCLYNATTCEVSVLCVFSCYISSISWMNDGKYIAVGLKDGSVNLWDVEKSKRVRSFKGHTNRVGSLAWNNWLLASGSKDHTIMFRDVRSPANSLDLGTGKHHAQEVCGLSWEKDLGYLASGGNDNRVKIWDMRKGDGSLFSNSDHTAAIKALSWSNFQRGLLATGGGSADKCIVMRDYVNNKKLDTIDTGSQVCNLRWSTTSDELVSTHGFSGNQIVVWSYPQMTRTAILTGHKSRVLYLALSPNGESIATAAGDCKLQFWKIFPQKKLRDPNIYFSTSHTIR